MLAGRKLKACMPSLFALHLLRSQENSRTCIFFFHPQHHATLQMCNLCDTHSTSPNPSFSTSVRIGSQISFVYDAWTPSVLITPSITNRVAIPHGVRELCSLVEDFKFILFFHSIGDFSSICLWFVYDLFAIVPLFLYISATQTNRRNAQVPFSLPYLRSACPQQQLVSTLL